jgi:transglutaminase-like putative cysteine protease
MPLSDVLRNRTSVCQDFARDDRSHAAAETAARYVSRYVRHGPKVQGAQVFHAWVSFFVPYAGWLSFDPTSDLMVSDNNVTPAWAETMAM